MNSPEEQVAKLRAAQMENCPSSLKAPLQDLFDAQDRATQAVGQRTKTQLRIDQLREWIQTAGVDSRVSPVKKELQELESTMPALDDRLDRARADLTEVAQRYADAQIEYRLEPVSEARREEARALLLGEQKAIQALLEKVPFDGGEFGRTGGNVFRLEFLIRKARAEGNDGEAKRLEAELAPALALKATFEAKLDVLNQARHRTAADVENQLQALIQQRD